VPFSSARRAIAGRPQKLVKSAHDPPGPDLGVTVYRAFRRAVIDRFELQLKSKSRPSWVYPSQLLAGGFGGGRADPEAGSWLVDRQGQRGVAD
jgi:hypothetical protein